MSWGRAWSGVKALVWLQVVSYLEGVVQGGETHVKAGRDKSWKQTPRRSDGEHKYLCFKACVYLLILRGRGKEEISDWKRRMEENTEGEEIEKIRREVKCNTRRKKGDEK